ncbi:MaoC family dehydratase [Enterovirga rhinocerotis]|uniref:Acyl dehydratase n=1 Tax=Enterovirga rhinocerotis TaxID=1339210 RepID=A0A4R7C8K9_9HYPH|nr:MaoC family dehydratase [Enterovirga rhinocerotis]TDR93186.1 acyl dehydratase [Enterovirga rhinocerotis]
MSGFRTLRLADLFVGQRFASASHRVTAEEIKTFARQFDPQPFHLDEEAAKDSLFGGLVASGWHTGAITMRLLAEGGLPFESGIIGGGGELRWLKPVRPGDTLRAESEILSITPSRSRPGQARVEVRVETLNQEGEVVQSFVPGLVVTR